MKLKCRPEDFRVEEISNLRPAARGGFGLYTLEKRGLTTFEAIGRIARHLGRPPSAISAGGLKDKYAVTVQHLTVSGKPAGRIRLEGLTLTPVGRCERPMTGDLLGGNRFHIVLRDMAPGEPDVVRARAGLAAAGIPNYFDEQRFGSLRGGEGFIARKLIDRDFEGALRMHLASPSRRDQSGERQRRRRVDELWGKWDRVFAGLPRGNERSVVAYLRDHPDGFARAFELIEGRLAQLYLFAYQSYLWNEVLVRVLRRRLEGAAFFELPYAPGRLLFFEDAPAEQLRALLAAEIPLPHRKAEFGDEAAAAAVSEVMGAQGLSLEDLRLRKMRKLRFRGGSRSALVRPGEMRVGQDRPDELYPGRRCLELSFSMPPGSYATLVVKFVGRDMLPGSRSARRGGRRSGK